MTAPTVWQSCLRGVDVFAELLRNLRAWVIGLLCASTQSPITQAHSCGVGNPIRPSCSAQTLRRVSSFALLSQRLVQLLTTITKNYKTCFCKEDRRQS